MAMKTGSSVSGFIATDPKLTYGQQGVARFYARMGIEHYRREEDGTFTQLEPSFHDLVVYRKTAEHAADAFAKGDRFVADGYVREYTYERDGHQHGGEEFVARRIGHDAARSTYTVDRTPQDAGLTQEQVTAQRAQAFEAPERPTQQPETVAMGQ